MRRIPSLLFLAALVGCSSLPAQMVGQFNAKRDFIVIKKDGALYWSPMSKTGDKLVLVGIGTTDKDDPTLLNVVTHSSSQFWPKLRYSSDYSRVTLDWDEVVAGAAAGRSTEFERAGTK